jgi:hypothetical protein
MEPAAAEDRVVADPFPSDKVANRRRFPREQCLHGFEEHRCQVIFGPCLGDTPAPSDDSEPSGAWVTSAGAADDTGF